MCRWAYGTGGSLCPSPILLICVSVFWLPANAATAARSRSPAASRSALPRCRTGAAKREEGRRAPEPHSGGVPSLLDAASLEVLRQLVTEDNDALLREYAERLA